IRLEPGTTKNAEGRTLPYGQLPELVELVETAWEHHQELAKGGTISLYVFTLKGKPIAQSAWYRHWHRACAAAGVRGRIPHDFRRTAVRQLTRAGVPQTVAMKVTGHKTPSVFQRYDIVSEQDIAEGLGRLNRAAIGKEKGKSAPTGRVADFPSRSNA
ncbi:MAG: tyrosine-type recombinase/integrase, partial [Thermoanaerobaculia bacterium]